MSETDEGFAHFIFVDEILLTESVLNLYNKIHETYLSNHAASRLNFANVMKNERHIEFEDSILL